MNHPRMCCLLQAGIYSWADLSVDNLLKNYEYCARQRKNWKQLATTIVPANTFGGLHKVITLFMLQSSSHDLLDHSSLGVSIVLDILPFPLHKSPLGARVQISVGGIAS